MNYLYLYIYFYTMSIIHLSLEKKTYEYVVHIADLHIHSDDTSLYPRTNEYRSVFNTLVSNISNNDSLTKNNTIITIAGDIFNDARKDRGKTSANGVFLFKELLQKLSNLGTIVIIPGNHDNNITFQHKDDDSIIDTLSSILNGMDGLNKTIFYLDKTGIYKLGNCIFYTTSVFDLDCRNGVDNYAERQALLPKRIADSESIHIGLLHCGMQGQVIQNGYIMKDCHYTLKDVEQYDITMLGDTHHHQFLNEHVAYPSSLIQQNYGESLTEHGYILWSLLEKKGVFHQIPNDYRYITIYSLEAKEYKLTDNIKKKIKTGSIYSIEDLDSVDFTEYSRIKYIYTITETESIESVRKTIENKTKIIKWNEQKILIANDADDSTIENNLNNLDTFIPYLKTKHKEDSKYYEFILGKIKELITNNKTITSNTPWCFKKLIVNNFQIYKGEHILLDLENQPKHTIISILGENGHGKSTILRALGYSIWSKDIVPLETYINNTSSTASCTLEFSYNDLTYQIIRKLEKGKQQPKESITLNVWENDQWIDKSDSFKKQTENKIKAIFGERDDAKTTWLSHQNSSTHFLNDNDNVGILSRLIGIDIYNIEYRIEKDQMKKLDKELIKINTSLDDLQELTGENTDQTILEQLDEKLSTLELEKKNIQTIVELEEEKKQYGTKENYDDWTLSKSTRKRDSETLKLELNNIDPTGYNNQVEDYNLQINSLTDKKNQSYKQMIPISKSKNTLLNDLETNTNLLIKQNKEKVHLEEQLNKLPIIPESEYESAISNYTTHENTIKNEGILVKKKEQLELEYKTLFKKMDSKKKNKLMGELKTLAEQLETINTTISENNGILNDFDPKLYTKSKKDLEKNQKKLLTLTIKEDKHREKLLHSKNNIKTIDYDFSEITSNIELLDEQELEIKTKLDENKDFNAIVKQNQTDLDKFNKLSFDKQCECCNANRQHYKIDTYEDNILNYTSRIKINTDDIADFTKTISNLIMFREIYRNYNTNTAIQQDIDNYTEELEEIVNNKNDTEEFLQTLQDTITKYKKQETTDIENRQLIKTKTSIHTKIHKKQLDLDTHNTLDKQIADIKSNSDTIQLMDPTLHLKTIEDMEEHKSIIDNYRERDSIYRTNLENEKNIRTTTQLIDSITLDIGTIDKNDAIDAEIQTIDQNRDTYTQKLQNLINDYNKITILDEEIESLNKSILNFKNYDYSIVLKNKETIEKLDRDLRITEMEKGKLMESIERFLKNKTRLDTLSADKTALTNNIALHNAYIDILDPHKGYSQNLLDKNLICLSNMVNQFVKFAGFNYTTTFKRPFIKVGTTSGKTKLIITHSKNNQKFSALSGAEEFTFNLATLTTLSHISNVANSPILAIDEGFSCLDEKHIGDLEPILLHLKKYYHYIINISHIPKVHEHSDIIKNCVDGTIL